MDSHSNIIDECIRLYSLYKEIRTPAQWVPDDGDPSDFSPSQKAFLSLDAEQRNAVALLLDESVALALGGVLAFFDGISGDAPPPRLVDQAGIDLEEGLYDSFIEAVDTQRHDSRS